MSFPAHLIGVSVCSLWISVHLSLLSGVPDASASESSSWSNGSAEHPHRLLRRPRLELVPLAIGEGAVLYVYNEDLINASLPLENTINCSVSGGHLKRIPRGWIRVTEVNLYSDSETEVWAAPPSLYNAFPGVLQKRTRLDLAYEVEGKLVCEDVLGLGLRSNPLILRFPRSEAFVVRFNASITQLNDVLSEYLKGHKMFGRPLAFISSGFIVRVSCPLSTEKPDGATVIERAKRVSEIVALSKNISLVYVRSTRVCPPVTEGTFSWPKTPAGRSAAPVDPCLDDEGAPTPLRRCLGDFFQGVYWDEAPTRPKRCSELTNRSESLKNLSAAMGEEGSFEMLADEVENGRPLLAFEIYLVSEALKSIASEMKSPSSGIEAPSISSLAVVVNGVLESGRKAVKMADSVLESSDAILAAVDELIAASASSATTTPTYASSPHFSALAVPSAAGIRGFAALADNSSPGKMIPVSSDQSLADVLDMSPKTAVILLQGPNDAGFASTLYEDDALFGATDGGGLRAQGPVVGVSLFRNGDLKDVKDTPITVLLLFSRGGRHSNCSFWDTRAGGKWSSEGCAPVPSTEIPGSHEMDACICTHLTHFCMLITNYPDDKWEEYGVNLPSDIGGEIREPCVEGEKRNQTSEADAGTKERDHDKLLGLITVVGCSISIVCLAATFLYAAMSPQWHRNVYRKIELNLFASVALLDAAELIVASLEVAPESDFLDVCVAMGVVLHYSVLATFAWMLVVAALQSLRLSPGTILDARRRAGTHLLLKASVFAWGVPAIPVVATLSVGTDLYFRRPQTAFCYPRGVAFYAGVLFPVGLALLLNTSVFVWLMRTLFCIRDVKMRVHCGTERSRTIRRFFYSLFLFCLLGLNWIVGLFLQPSKSSSKELFWILSYVFCSTAALHGSSLFLFFVACEPRLGDKLSEDMSYLKRRSHGVAVRFTTARKSINSVFERNSVNSSLPVRNGILPGN